MDVEVTCILNECEVFLNISRLPSSHQYTIFYQVSNKTNGGSRIFSRQRGGGFSKKFRKFFRIFLGRPIDFRSSLKAKKDPGLSKFSAPQAEF